MGLALVSSAPSEAASAQSAKEKTAKKACASGDYRRGVEILAELYVDTDNTTYIFNQGRCYEQNHQWVSAIDRFREYLRKNYNATAADRADVEKHIADCESFREQDRKTIPPAAASSPRMPTSNPASTPSNTDAKVANAGQSAPTKGSRGSGLRAAGIATGSVGIATALAGLVLNLKANALADDFNRTQDPATKTTQSSYRTGSMICYGAGAGLVVTGAVLYFLGRAEGGKERAAQVSVSPALTPSAFALTLRTVF